MSKRHFVMHGMACATAIAAIPAIGQEFTWDPNVAEGIQGGSGVLDQGVTPNFQGPGGTPGVVYPGGAEIGFQVAAPAGNVVTVNGGVEVSRLAIGVSGYNIVQGSAGALTGVGGASLDINMASETELDISAALQGDIVLSGNGALELSGTQAIGDFTVQNAARLRYSGAGNLGSLTNFGDATNDGTVGTVTNNAGAEFVNTRTATVLGDFDNFGTASVAGSFGFEISNGPSGDMTVFDDLDVVGAIDNSGTLNLSNGRTNAGAVFNSGDFLIEAGATLVSDFDNRAGGQLNVSGTLAGTLDNPGFSTTDLSGLVEGNVLNGGQLIARGRATITGNLSNGDAVVDLTANPGTADVLTIGGNLTSDGTYRINLAVTPTGLEADRVVVGGDTTGAVILAFDPIVTGNTNDSVLVFDVNDAGANDFVISSQGLPASTDLVVYSLFQPEENGDVFVVSQLDPGVGSIASNIVLTQSLIGALVNRPTSPFVIGPAYDDPNPCGTGAWSRFQGGQAEASNRSANGVSQVQTTVNADYTGFQAGGDFACFKSVTGGWDFAIGAVGGFNTGQIEQPIFSIDPANPTQQTDIQTSLTVTDFDQRYFSIYGTAAIGVLSADLQLRQEQTDFSFTNTGVNGAAGLGLQDAELRTDATTISGALNYAYAIPDTNFALVPTVGFAATRGTSGTITFEDGSGLEVGDFESDIGFAGLTGAYRSFPEGGTSSFTTFATATYYADFSNEIQSTLVSSDSDPQRTSNTTLGSYSELSIGTNYLQVLQSGAPGGAKQVSANLRVDARFGGEVDSWGLVGQVRVQF